MKKVKIIPPKRKPRLTKRLSYRVKIEEASEDKIYEENNFPSLDLTKFPFVVLKHFEEEEQGNYIPLKAPIIFNKTYLLRPSEDPTQLLFMLYIDYGYVKKNRLDFFVEKDESSERSYKLKSTCLIRIFNHNKCEIGLTPMLHSSFFPEHPISFKPQLFVGYINNLAEKTLYYYVIECYDENKKLIASTELKWLKTGHRDLKSPFFFLATSDLHGGKGAWFRRGKAWGLFPRQNKRLVKLIDHITSNQNDYSFNKGYDLAVSSGDTTENASYHEYWSDLFNCCSPLFSSVPFVPAIGNHDYYQGGFWRGNWTGNKKTRTSRHFHAFVHTPREHGKEGHYYSFDHGNAHLLYIDSNGDKWGNEKMGCDSDLWRWVEKDLADWRSRLHQQKGPQFCLAFLHSSILTLGYFGSSREGSDEKAQRCLTPLFRKYGVNACFFGHDHIYQRSKWEDTQYICVGSSSGTIADFFASKQKKTDYTIYRAEDFKKARGYGVVFIPPRLDLMNDTEQKNYIVWLNSLKGQLMNSKVKEYFNIDYLDDFNYSYKEIEKPKNKDRKEALIKNEILANLLKNIWWRYYTVSGHFFDHAFMTPNLDNFDSSGKKNYEISCLEEHVR